MRSITVTVASLGLMTQAWAAQMAVPDPAITPGAVWTTSAKEACQRPLPVRPEHWIWNRIKELRMSDYNIPWSERGNYELDHLIPRCAGGADDVTNLWLQPWVDAIVKDRDEIKLCRILCDDPTDERLRAVQDYFRRGMWAR